MFKKNWFMMMLALLALVAVLAACGSGTTDTTDSNESAAEPAATSETAAAVAGKVGIVLPTKDEPRWVQDETRFKEALAAAGYDVEILFSQGDSAKEKANVEDLITKGVQVLIITPQDGTAAAAAAEAAQ
ncbi:MAG: substrate-binding domain-containing protein, partial [Candidatus Promineifilaceae bacterium]